MEDDPETFARERVFHSAVREYVLFLLLFLMLYGASYCLTSIFRKRKDDLFSDEEDAAVHRISLWVCNFCLAVSFGAALLLPISIVANEVLHLYPQSQYIEWLNSSLIQGLWNIIFLLSNMGVFMLLPFAYLFTESEGLPGTQRGLAARVYETFLVLSLLALVLIGLTYMISTLINYKHQGIKSFFSEFSILLNSDLWNVYLPFLYSCVSCLGVFTLLICTPVGFSRLFSVIGNLIIKPKFFTDLNEECYIATLEEETLKRRIPHNRGNDLHQNGFHNRDFMQLFHNSEEAQQNLSERLKIAEHEKKMLQIKELPFKLVIGTTLYGSGFCRQIQTKYHIQTKNLLLGLIFFMIALLIESRDQQQRVSYLRRNLGYPVAMLLLLFLTGFSVLIVVHNTLELLVGIKALPLYTQQFALGISSLSALGTAGAAVDLIIILIYRILVLEPSVEFIYFLMWSLCLSFFNIFGDYRNVLKPGTVIYYCHCYLWLASMVGFYTLPVFTRLKPRIGETSMTQIIGNCAVLLILSSALPVLARILGITNFDLLGDFGRIEWLGHFWLVLLYNIGFAGATCLCLMKTFTESMRQELFIRLKSLQFWRRARDKAE